MRASFTLTGLASVALLTTLLTTAQCQPAGLAAYDALLEREVSGHGVGAGLEHAEARRAEGWNLGNHGHKHAHQNKKRHFKPSPALIASAAKATDLEKRGTVAAPVVSSAVLLGDSVTDPSLDYFWPQHAAVLPSPLPSSLLTVALDIEPPLATNYPIYNGTGALVLTPDNVNDLYRLTTVPSISRDSGKGGYLNGSKLFIFCDTETFTTTNATHNGAFTGFCSNSVAVDWGFNAANGQPVAIRDKVGQWTNNNGGMRGWVPFTTGEKAYNLQMGSQGGRIAIWPSSSITALSDGVAIQYSPIVLINSTNGVSFHQLGVTMYEITIPNPRSGPVANRVAPLLFGIDQPGFGVVGALRSWGSQGVGGTDGWVYVFLNDANGLRVGRSLAAGIASASSYEYYWSSIGAWNSTPTTEVFLECSISASDIFYSPMHQTFIHVYADRYIDNQISYRYLVVPEGGIAPAYDGTDFAENIVNYEWSSTVVLFQAPVPGNGRYIYSSGANLGYFEDDDITNGGNMMLIHWTAPTGQSSDTVATSYAMPAAVVTWG